MTEAAGASRQDRRRRIRSWRRAADGADDHLRLHLVLSDLLGACDEFQDRRRGDQELRFVAGAAHPQQLSLHHRPLEAADILSQLDHRFSRRHGAHLGHVDLRRLRDFPAAVSRPAIAVVDHSGKLHDPGAGADRESLHHYRVRESHQHLRGHRSAAPDRAGHGDRLQAVFRTPCRETSERLR